MSLRSPHPRRLGAAVAVALAGAGCDPSRMPLGPAALPPPIACDGCHGAPPASGAHLLHAAGAHREALAYGDVAVLEDLGSGGSAYAFGCGHCHPLDEAQHLADAGADGLPDVELAPPADPATPAGLRSRNAPTAAWDPVTRTCRGVYCHSSGQRFPEYVETPPWDAAPGSLGCGGCHGNPPRYPSAGPASAAPNGHLQLASDGWEWGHYAGMPGPWHGSRHGGPGAASPITCQTCHFETTDPTCTAPGGFFWLDTTGDYALPGGDASRLDTAPWLHPQCKTCHDGLVAPAGRGRVLALRHVNGRADVAFDPRAALPAGAATGLPALATSDPVAPYYVSPFNVTQVGWTLPPGGELRDASGGGVVLMGTLDRATYDPGSRTCSNVTCHVGRQWAADQTPPLASPLRWGDPHYGAPLSCNGCHPMN